jgi:hypothetical protein
MPRPSISYKFFFRGQAVHLLLLLILLVGACLLVDFKRLAECQVLGIGAHIWFAISLTVPIFHQAYVWLAWRSELCFGAVTGRLGSHAFVIYQIVFMVLFLARPVSLILLTIADHDSFEMSMPARIVICVVLGLPAAYTLYSVVCYFGVARAAGVDHFDESYRNKPLVTEGIFKYTSNSMYSFAFLTLWVIAIAGASWAGLVVAAFSHAYIWVHYYCTERPDMRLIYGAR